MSIEENKSVVRRYYEDAPYHPEVTDQIFASQVLWHTLCPPNQPDFLSSPQLEKDAYRRHMRTWGGWGEHVDELVAEGDRVMVRWTFHGIQQEEYLGIQATNRPVTFSGMNVFRLVDNRIVEVWSLWDKLGEWQQLGILPDSTAILAHVKDSQEQDK